LERGIGRPKSTWVRLSFSSLSLPPSSSVSSVSSRSPKLLFNSSPAENASPAGSKLAADPSPDSPSVSFPEDVGEVLPSWSVGGPCKDTFTSKLFLLHLNLSHLFAHDASRVCLCRSTSPSERPASVCRLCTLEVGAIVHCQALSRSPTATQRSCRPASINVRLIHHKTKVKNRVERKEA
jgi:hypothetical protein